MSVSPPCPSTPPMQCPPAASTVSSPTLPTNYLSLPKLPLSLASPSSSTSASVTVSDLCVCNPYISVNVPLIPVLAVIVIVLPPCNYCHQSHTFLSLVIGSVTYVHFVPEATERLVQKKRIWLENPRPSENRCIVST